MLILIMEVNNQRHFMLEVTWKKIVRKNVFDIQKWLYEC